MFLRNIYFTGGIENITFVNIVFYKCRKQPSIFTSAGSSPVFLQVQEAAQYFYKCRKLLCFRGIYFLQEEGWRSSGRCILSTWKDRYCSTQCAVEHLKKTILYTLQNVKTSYFFCYLPCCRELQYLPPPPPKFSSREAESALDVYIRIKII